jgi:hypothetical protein
MLRQEMPNMEASEWAQQRIQSAEAERAAEHVRDALNLERQRIRTSNFPDLLEAVVKAFQDCRDAYNKLLEKGERTLEFYHQAHSLYVLKRDAGFSEMHIQVNSKACAFRVIANDLCSFRYNLTYTPLALSDGRAMLTDGRSSDTPAAVAQKAVDAFLDGREAADRL